MAGQHINILVDQGFGYVRNYLPSQAPSGHGQITEYYGGSMANAVSPMLLKVPDPYERPTTSASTHTIDSSAPTLKRTSCDFQEDRADSTRTGSKRPKKDNGPSRERAPRTEQGYFCTHPECDKNFNLLSEAKKHFKAKHTPYGIKPHGCTIPSCEFRAMWPKDVRRHLKQRHGVLPPQDAPMLPSPTHVAPTIPAINTIDLATDPNFPYESQLAMSPQAITPTAHVPQPLYSQPATTNPRRRKSRRWSSLQNVIMSLAKLKITKDDGEEEDDQKFIMVSQDRDNWRKVYVDGVKTADHLIHKIIKEFPLQASQPDGVLLHRHKSAGRLGERLAAHNIMSAVSKALRGKRTLEIVFTPVHSHVPIIAGYTADQPGLDTDLSWR